MFVKNTSNKIIGIGQDTILPGQEVEISDTFKGNPVIAAYEKLGYAAVHVKTEKSTGKANRKSNGAANEEEAAK